MSKPNRSTPAIPFEDVLEEELEHIAQSRAKRGVPYPLGKGENPIRKALHSELIGLAFSGGGIRSATFNLGILQGLAKWDLLKSVDYLSTVSGGGYIGSWLHAWVKRSPGGLDEVCKHLAHDKIPRPKEDVLQPVGFLRRYANYLTPRTGLLSSDTWTMISIWMRNTLLNQMILFLAFAALLLAPRTLKEVVDVMTGNPISLFLAIPLMFLAVFLIGLNLSTFESGPTLFTGFLKLFGMKTQRRGDRWFHRPGIIQMCVVVPMILTAFLTSSWFSYFIYSSNISDLRRACLLISVGFFAFLCLNSVVGGLERGFANNRRRSVWRAAFLLPLINAGSAAIGGLAIYLVAVGIRESVRPPLLSITILAWGVPAFLLAVTFVIVLQLGLLGKDFADDRREWWSRLGAALMMHMIGWIAVCSIAIYGPQFLFWLHSKLDAFWASGAFAGWVGTVAAGLWASSSPRTGDPEKLPSPILNFFAKLAPPVFIVGIFLFLSLLVHVAALYDCRECFAVHTAAELANQHLELMSKFPGWKALLWMVTLAFAAWLLAIRVDINEFSLHQFYRNRLVRCYLGASRDKDRRPNLFTGFDPDDDFDLKDLNPIDDAYGGPYPIINTALNLVHGENLAWQERKAESFIFTPAYCGYDVENGRSTHPRDGELRMLSEYGYRPTSLFSTRGGPKLGEALAISGAAASPNSGYHSAPATGFLMTVFDVRLGWWIGNPRHRVHWKSSSPTLGLLYLFYELMGMTNDRREFIYLSDGGHFENLAIYELVRRRCRFIIACDAEQDGLYKFEGLGNAIRKCRTDFGVEIDIITDRLRPQGDARGSGAHCVVGTIRYPELDGNGENILGTLLYIKASVTGDEPSDVIEHGRRDPLFPHTPTTDQWFDESQFESYRRLGLHIANTVFRNVAEDICLAEDRERFFRMLSQQWYPPSRAVQAKFTEHSRACSDLLERLRKDSDLRFMAGQISPEWPTLMRESVDPMRVQNWLPHTDKELRAGFQLCNSMIQLMENVYIDLNLEEEWAHPDNRGWMNLFNHWVWSSMFRVTWSASASCYGARFQTFCQKRLELPLGDVQVCRGQVSDLNFYEKKRFEEFGDSSDTVWSLELRVDNPAGGDQKIAYRFGFALVDTDRVLRFYRVQNHVRKMGLWTAVEPILRKTAGIKSVAARIKKKK